MGWKTFAAISYFLGVALIGIAFLSIGVFIGASGTNAQAEFEAFFSLIGLGTIIIGAGWMFAKLS
jgi:hypothetical protein